MSSDSPLAGGRGDERGGASDGQLGPLMDEFVERYRRGERPGLTEFIARCPHLEADIRELFPALVAIEQADPGSSAARGQPIPERLGDFRIEREVARGGMGIVFKAVQESLGRTVALKVLPGLAMLNEQSRLRFQREARTASMLHHSNIVPVFSVGEHEGLMFYAMQFIEGRPLDGVLKELRRLRNTQASSRPPRGSPDEPAPSTRETTDESSAAMRQVATLVRTGLSEDREASSVTLPEFAAATSERDSSAHAIQSGNWTRLDSCTQSRQYWLGIAGIGVQAAEALAYVHGRGVLHRDIKPSNLLLDRHGTIWVVDFGLARTSQDGITESGDLVGTLRYMAPERFQSECDERSDIYSLGLLLYELLVLKPAFDEPDRARLIRLVTQCSPTPPRMIDPRIPRDLETIVLKAIAREPASRYQTARDLVRDLECFRSSRPIIAKRISSVRRVWLWCRRNPVVAMLLLAVLLLTASSVVASFLLRNEQVATVQNLNRALEAESTGQMRLYQSLLAQAEAIRSTHQPGRRRRGLEAVRAAAELRDRLKTGPEDLVQLRTEAIACLSLFDIEPGPAWKPDRREPPRHFPAWGVDQNALRFAYPMPSGEIVIRSLTGFQEQMRLPSTGPFILHTCEPTTCFSPDGRYVAASGLIRRDDRSLHLLQVWNTISRRLVLSVAPGTPEGRSSACGFAFTADSRSMLFPSREEPGLLRADLPETGQAEVSIRPFLSLKETPGLIALSPDGSRLAVDYGTWKIDKPTDPVGVRILDTKSGRELVRLPHEHNVRAIAWSPDGTHLVTGTSDNDLLLWNTASPSAPVNRIMGHSLPVSHATFHPDGTLLLSTAQDGSSCFWTLTGDELLRAGPGLSGFSADGRYAASIVPNHAVSRCELRGLNMCRTLGRIDQREAVRFPYALKFSPDGTLLAVGTHNSAQFWDLSSSRLLVESPVRRGLAISFHPAGQTVLVGGSSGAQQWSVPAIRAGRLESSPLKILESALPPHDVLSDLAWSENGERLLVIRRLTSVLSAGPPFAAESPRKEWQAQRFVHNGAVSPNGQWIATTTLFAPSEQHVSSGILIFDAVSGREQARLPKLEGRVAGVAFSPDGRWLASSETDGQTIWSVHDWQQKVFLSAADDGAGLLTFSPDSLHVAVSSRSSVSLYSTRDWSLIAKLKPPVDVLLSSTSPGAYGRVAFSPDGSLLAAGSSNGTIILWNLGDIRRYLAGLSLDWQ